MLIHSGTEHFRRTWIDWYPSFHSHAKIDGAAQERHCG
jgi:hypothetical protein